MLTQCDPYAWKRGIVTKHMLDFCFERPYPHEPYYILSCISCFYLSSHISKVAAKECIALTLHSYTFTNPF
jgi:hypothetical protein